MTCRQTDLDTLRDAAVAELAGHTQGWLGSTDYLDITRSDIDSQLPSGLHHRLERLPAVAGYLSPQNHWQGKQSGHQKVFHTLNYEQNPTPVRTLPV